MRRCIQLAKNGEKNAAPNPMVGAVVVAPDGRILGEGYHVRCGEGHAEVNALASVRKEDEPLLQQSTIYVSLEPCAHYGKTPPCADLIVDKGLKRCVIGCVDPFAQVQGRGIQKLRDAGVEVIVGVLEKDCLHLNRHFFTFHQKHRPFITLKWAQTADGIIGILPRYQEDSETPLLISNRHTQMLCHKRRAEHQAILVGRHTLETDHPSLTVRAWVGENPRPYILSHATGGIDGVLEQMRIDGVQSLLVEGGRETLQSFIDRELWDEAYIETSPQPHPLTHPVAGEYIPAPILHHAQQVSSDIIDGHRIDAFIKQN